MSKGDYGDSGIYQGRVRHRRFSPKARSFSYKFSMFGLDVDDLEGCTNRHWLFGQRWFNPVRFCEKDYVKSEPGSLKQRIASKVNKLGGHWDKSKVIMLAQCRALGVYFSPINLYFCFNSDNECQWMLAEVSNTPWNERHYYLVDIASDKLTDKAFHVSPFMPMEMKYLWKVKPIGNKAFVHLENHPNSGEKVFDATMALTKQPLSSMNLTKQWLSLPFAVMKVLALIYWQALKIILQGIPFIPYPKQRG